MWTENRNATESNSRKDYKQAINAWIKTWTLKRNARKKKVKK